MVNFTLVIHNHQPVGNFPHVIRHAAESAYIPFLKTLSKYPKIRIGLHFSGVLLESLEELAPEVIHMTGDLIRSGQVELVGGAFGEPILPACSETAISEHIEKQNNLIYKFFGAYSEGLWLAERVWEEWLPAVLSQAGISYTFLDDFHFLSAGLSEKDLLCRWITEHSGNRLDVFPLSKRLRYLIPFRDPNETVEWMLSLPDDAQVSFGDDGEKFGIWPHTHETCYKERWLERFFETITAYSDKIRILLPSEAFNQLPAKGPIYLPTCSYPEMMEWSLPPSSQREIRNLKPESGLDSTPSEAYLRGSSWKNFLHRYPESNRMHKRVMLASEDVMDEIGEMGEHLLRAQCNCAYWHGVFGGIYLPHLRRTIYSEIIKAENECGVSREALSVYDFDFDGLEEHILSNDSYTLIVAPHSGGQIIELDSNELEINITDVLARREEGYSNKIASLENSSNQGSIHDGIWIKDGQKIPRLTFDEHLRAMFSDRFYLEWPKSYKVRENEILQIGDFVENVYETIIGDEEACIMKRLGIINSNNVLLEKQVTLSGEDVKIIYKITNKSSSILNCFFAPEINLSSNAGYDDYLSTNWSGIQTKRDQDIESHTENFLMRTPDSLIHLNFTKAIGAYQYVVQTISNSEGGIETIDQGLAIAPIWKLDLGQSEQILLEFSLRCKRV